MESSFKTWIDNNYNINYHQEYHVSIYINGVYNNSYYIDFYFPDINLGIELDGSHHLNQIESDKQRDSVILSQYNIPIYRISHKEYKSLSKLDEVKTILKNYEK